MKGEQVHVWRGDAKPTLHRPRTIEEPGRWYFPPLAAAVTGGGRLLLHLARKLVERAGGTVAYWDTDSPAVVATLDGSLVPCPGGSERDEHGRETIPALSYAQVLEQVQAALEPLNPYPVELRPYEHAYLPGTTRPDRLGMPREESGSWARVRPPGLLELEDENFDGGPSQRRQLYLSADASKAYDLYFCELPALTEPSQF